GHQDWIQRTTGIPLSPHFGGPKFLFSVRNDPDLKGRVESGEALFGPISSFVTHGLTGSQVIDESIAGRSLLLNLESTAWDPDLLDLFEVPESCLPRLVPTCQHVGDVVMGEQSIPVWCVIGDQQASLVGQERWGEGDVAMNLGTSGSVLVNSGRHPTVVPSLLSNVLYSFPRERHFLIEGTINGVGSLFRWLEDYLNLPHEEMNWEKRCVQATDGILVPGISGLAAPYWTGEFDTAFMGFAHPEDPDRIVRAAMESVGFLVKDICEVLGNVTAREPKEIVASGGFSKPVLLQFIADLLNVPVWSSKGSDMTALGVARLVAQQTLGIPLNRSTGIRDRQIVPTMSSDQRVAEISRWRGALRVLRIINSRSGGKEANT
ncbi:MAG: FGGY-family carbohydrate kinase, partial [Fidelibacterota bacterium]